MNPRKTFIARQCLAFLFFTVPAFAQTGESLPVTYQATKLNQGGSTVIVLIPKPFERYERSKVAENVLNAFDELKIAHPYEYGKTTLLIDGQGGKIQRVILNLDPDRRDYHDLVASEVFHTMKGLGVPEVKAPLIRDNPLDESVFAATVFLPIVQYWQALPPHVFNHAVVSFSPTEFMPSELFYYKLKQGDRALMEKVLSGLSRQDERVRLTILASFPNLPVTNRAAVLLPLLDDGSVAVQISVLKLLENENQKEVNERLCRLVEGDSSPTVKLTAVKMLSARGIHKYDIFIELEKLSDPSEEVVVQTISRLVTSRNPSVASALLSSLHHLSAAVREAARSGLITLGANDTMFTAMADDTLDNHTRESFAKHLSEHGTAEQQLKALAWLLSNGSEEGATYAAGRLAERRPPEGLNLLYNALLRVEQGVRIATMKAIGSYRAVASIKPLLGAPKTMEEKTIVEQVVVEVIAAQPLDTVLSLMEDSDVTVRRLAMKALGDSLKGAAPPARAISVLQARLSDKDLGVRRAAVYTLARVPDERVVASIMGLAGDPDAEIREAAVVAATRSSDPRSNEILLKALSDESDRVKLVAIDGVAARRLKAAREQLQMMGHYQDVQIRRKAVKAYLSMLEPGEAAQVFDFLNELLYDTDPEVKIAAISAARQIHERRAIVAISGLVIDPNRDVKVAALDALAASGEKDALEGIYKAVFDVGDKTIRLYALDALAKLGKREALDFLGELLKLESDADVRNKAAEVQKILLEK